MVGEEPRAPGAPEPPEPPDAPRARAPQPRLRRRLLPELSAFLARLLFCVAPVYLAGYLGLSTIWLLLGAGLWAWWRSNRRGKLGRLAAAFAFLDHERQFISHELRDQHLPAWVSGGRGVGARRTGRGGSVQPAPRPARRPQGGRELRGSHPGSGRPRTLGSAMHPPALGPGDPGFAHGPSAGTKSRAGHTREQSRGAGREV